MSFANEFKRAVKGIEEEIAHFREFDELDGMPQQLAALEELRDKWGERTTRFAGRGKLPTEPFDWEDDKTTRRDLKENMTRIIKAAAAAARTWRLPESVDDGDLPPARRPSRVELIPLGSPRQSHQPIPSTERLCQSFP